MKINESLLGKNLSNHDEYPLYDLKDWSAIKWYRNGDISLDEMITISELYMMYGSRYDEVIKDDYDKAIKGYKNWNDFRRRTQLFYLGKEHYIDKEEILYNLIIREFKYLFDYNRSVNDFRNEPSKGYIETGNRIIILLRLYHLKRYSKSILINWLEDLSNNPSYEPQRIALALRLTKTWSYGFLSRILSRDLTRRLCYLSHNENPIYSYDIVFIPENEEDNKLLEKFNKIY